MNKKKLQGYIFIILSVFFIGLVAYTAFYFKNLKRRKDSKEPWTFVEFLNNGEEIGIQTISIGIIYGMILGIIDVLGIWYVLKYLGVFMPKGELLDAGIGEVYSSVMAVIVGTFISHAIKTIIPPKKPIPLWSDALGVLIGCLGTLLVTIEL
jgi:ABC-type transporter Mla maintaining outer membrane lipid asymmetry permease subunit MlaE